MRIKALISLLFVSLITLHVVHDAIPHHHHNSGSCRHSGHDLACCGHHTEFSDKDDIACHAFNDLEYFKSRVSVIIDPEAVFILDNLWMADEDCFRTESYRNYISDHRILLRDYKYYLNIRGLRAPPSCT
jgi:hypothetical protein